MTPEDPGQHRHCGVAKGRPDWIYIGSLVLIAICLLGMVCITWTRYQLGK